MRLAPRLVVVVAALVGCTRAGVAGSPSSQPSSQPSSRPGAAAVDDDPSAFATLPAVAPGHEVATFAGGCFWCMESDFEAVEGVVAVTSGYTGGHVERPSYEQVGARTTGHAEAIQVIFDPERVSYEQLLEKLWRSVDPTTDDRQFCDVGDEYRPEIFVHDESQRALAEASRQRLLRTFRHGPIKVRITRATTFYPAERYHQDFAEKNPARYHAYRQGCGRDRRLQELWGEPEAAR